MDLATAKAVITGGASGLGAATARELTSRGVKVTLWDLNEDLGNEVAKHDLYIVRKPRVRTNHSFEFRSQPTAFDDLKLILGITEDIH